MSDAALLARAQAAVRERWPRARLSELEPLPGGISSLTFCAGVDGAPIARVVLKVAPPGLEPVRNRDVLRQARVLRALAGTPGVAVPEVLVVDTGAPPLFVMEHIRGESFEPWWDVVPVPPSPRAVDARARAAARMLAALAAVDPADVGLRDEPVLSPGDELARWTALYETVGEDLRAGEQDLRLALAARVPASEPGMRPAVVHGDYRLGNILFDGERVGAIIDWEIWSVGDRRCDLAWLMVFCDPVMERGAGAGAGAGLTMPPAAELLAEWMRATGLSAPPPDLPWFQALCRYKLAAALAVLIKRSRRSGSPDPSLERAAATTPALLECALAVLRED
ncbi:MAG: phosphotransferase family protein [Solirubrobacteraceae bacterium]